METQVKFNEKYMSYIYISRYRVSHSGGGGWGGGGSGGGGMSGGDRHPAIFFENPPIKTDAPLWGIPQLKNEARPSEKQIPPLKHETPLHEMIPRKSTINNNLKSS